jgi:hypothetical protein
MAKIIMSIIVILNLNLYIYTICGSNLFLEQSYLV